MNLFFGVVEDRTSDSLMMSRYKVRVVGVHSPLMSDIATIDLPWATPVQNNSAAVSGIGSSASGYQQGSTVVVIFADSDYQIPLILGAVAGIPGGGDITGLEAFAGIMSDFNIMPSSAPPEDIGGVEQPWMSKLTKSEIRKLIPLIPELKKAGATSITSIGMGKYQFSNTELSRLGYIDSNSEWRGLRGITSADQFLANAQEQYDAQETLFRINRAALLSSSIISDITPKEKVAGLLIASQVLGISAVYKLIGGEDDIVIDTTNSAGESCQEFYFAGYRTISGTPTSEAPTKANIDLDSKDTSGSAPANSQKTDSRQGFKDPDNVYPKAQSFGESDIPRLARAYKVYETCVGLKIAGIVENIPVANSASKWKQSPIPYAAVYPNNSVYQSPSGHVMEFDDTPGATRMHFYHKSGTFWEVDNAGNGTEKTKGIRTIIVEKDELVYIQGSGHVTIDGDMSLKVNKALSVEITGNADIKVKGDVTYDVGGNFSVLAKGSISFDAPAVNIAAGMSKAVQPFNPVINVPAPVTRAEIADIEAENTDGDSPLSPLSGPPKMISKCDPTKPTSVIDRKYPTSEKPFIIPANIADQDYFIGLSNNFNIRNVSVGDSGSHFPFKGQHGLSASQLALNLQALSFNCLEVIREKYKNVGFKLNSVMRQAGNPHSAGRKTVSQHEKGQAADISFNAIRYKPRAIARQEFYDIAVWIRDNVLFDQLILETTDAGYLWIHISYIKDGVNRRNVLTMNNHSTVCNGLVVVE